MRIYGLARRRFRSTASGFRQKTTYICSETLRVRRCWKSVAEADIRSNITPNGGAGELWGVDLSDKQLDNAQKLLSESGYSAKLLCAKMEEEIDVPKEYFDYVYSIYGIGWTTDLQGTFDKIASYLKKDGVFIFSWHHTLNYCVAWSCNERKEVFEGDKLVMTKSYYDESYFKMPVHDSEIILCNRKISTYINALAKAGFVIERFVEETDEQSLCAQGEVDPKTKKSKMMPLSFCVKVRKM